MISYDDALKLLKKYLKDERKLDHSIGAAEFAYDFAKKIHKKHPSLADPLKVRILVLLHDIGFEAGEEHEFRSVEILRSEGLSELADIAMHGYTYEKQLVNGVDDKSLLPKTIEQKILVYADLRYKNSVMSLKERFDDIRSRREGELLKALDHSEKRAYAIEEELMGLLE